MAVPIAISKNVNFFVTQIIDDMCNSVTATVVYQGTAQPIQLTLWQGQDYVAIGNWTNAQAINQISLLIDQVILNTQNSI